MKRGKVTCHHCAASNLRPTGIGCGTTCPFRFEGMLPVIWGRTKSPMLPCGSVKVMEPSAFLRNTSTGSPAQVTSCLSAPDLSVASDGLSQ